MQYQDVIFLKAVYNKLKIKFNDKLVDEISVVNDEELCTVLIP